MYWPHLHLLCSRLDETKAKSIKTSQARSLAVPSLSSRLEISLRHGLPSATRSAHRQHGGEADPVADDLIAEVVAEEEAGQTVSHQPGRA